MRDIALIGKMGSGKDTVAQYLVKHHGYTRVSFADSVREMVLRINPWVTYENDSGDWLNGISAIRLSDLIRRIGWNRAKREHPEVRRLLQSCGMAVRDLAPDLWIDQAYKRMNSAGPNVITDTRFMNEVLTLRADGFAAVRVVRLGLAEGSDHISETELDAYQADHTLANDGTVPELHERIERMLSSM